MDRWRELLRYLFRRYWESRRALILTFVGVVVSLYWFAPWFSQRARGRHVIGDASSTCLSERLSRHTPARELFDTAYHQLPPVEDDVVFYPYVGNGLIGLNPVGEREIHIKAASNRVVGLKINYYPTLTASIDGLTSKDAVVTEWKDGTVTKMQCFYSSGCIRVESTTYAHRTRPSILVQDVRFFNPSSKHVIVDLQQTLASAWGKATTRKEKSRTKTETEISVTTGMATVNEDFATPTAAPDRKTTSKTATTKVILVSLASTIAPQSVDLGPGKTARLHIVTSVAVSNVSQDEKELLKKKNFLEKSVVANIDTTLNIEAKRLRTEHAQVWNNLWKTGFSISTSKAAGAINGDRINSTIYYVMSNVRSPIHEVTEEGLNEPLKQQQKNDLEKLLYFPDRCYSGHHTLQVPKLWSEVSSEISIARLAYVWILTLEKQGCASMLKAGADGLIEAIALSIGGLKFTNDHLEFGMEAKDLHRDVMSFRRLSYGNATHLNITVVVGEDNKAQIYAAVDRSDRNYYACDAGCLDPPVKLGNKLIPFPVKRTEPKTAVLYITADKQHMEDLKHTIHVHEVGVAPPHEHHVLALHRHGHHLGGLPPFFWVSVAFLIVIFHLFLVKLICNECKFKSDSRPMAANTRRFQM